MIAALRYSPTGRGSKPLAAIAVAGLASLVLLLAAMMPPRLKGDLEPASIALDSGFAYLIRVPLRPPIGLRVIGDGAGISSAQLQLFEDGKPLGPGQVAHTAIRAEGRGRYSHWGPNLWFSSSDASDPRSNGRRYSIAATASIHPVAAIGVVLLDAMALIFAWPWLQANARARRGLVHGGYAIALVLAALLAIGAFGRVNAADGEPKDAALLLATLVHAVGGVVILLAQWAAGAGLARRLLGLRSQASFADVLTLGFALSLPIVAILSVIALVLPYGPLFAAAGWMTCCLLVRGWHPPDREWMDLTRAVAAALPLAISFGCWLALLWHGPTETLGGTPTGDLVYYSTSIVSLSTQFYPYLNLGYAYTPLNLYFNLLFPLLGAALGRIMILDPFLFMTACGGVFFVLSLGMMLHLYVLGTGIRTSGRSFGVASVTLVLAFVVANRYPYWVVESIPVICAVPLTIAVVYWARKAEAWARIVAFLMAVAGSALSKVVGATVLAPFAAAAALSQVFEMSRTLRIAAAAAALAGLAYAAGMIYQGTLSFSVASPGPASVIIFGRDHPGLLTILPYALRDISAVLLAGTAFLLTDRLRAAVIALAFLLFLVYPFLFQFDFVCAAIVLGLVACDDPARLQRFRVPVLAAYLLALPAALLTDPAGLSSGFVWLICIGGVVAIALAPRAISTRDSWSGIAAATLLLGLGLTAVARGNWIVTSGWQAGLLTPQVRQVWLAVKRLTPPDVLIFTDQTGSEPTLLGAWNTYAFIGARQIFVSNLYINPETRIDNRRARQVLKENDDVLQGRLRPEQLSLPKRYDAYYAVVSCSRMVPAKWHRIFSNDIYCLFEMTAGQ